VWALSDERRGDAAAALKRFDRAVRLYSDESPVAAASSVAGKIRTLQILGEEHHAIFVGEHYLDSLERGGLASPSVRLRVLSPMVLAYLAGGFTSQAGEVAEQCTRLMPRVNDPEALAIAHINVASVQQAEGHYDDASRSLHQAEQLFDALDLQQESGVVNLARGVIEVRRGKYDEGRRSLSRAIDLLEGTGNDVQRMNAELELGRLDRLVGELERSAERLESALGKLPPDGQGRLRAWGHRELGMSLAHLDPGEAEKNFLVAVDLYEQMDEPIELARTYAALADHRLSQGEKESALEAYRYAGSALEALPDM
jgi:tetratricopeptide (TPR) repeat protein